MLWHSLAHKAIQMKVLTIVCGITILGCALYIAEDVKKDALKEHCWETAYTKLYKKYKWKKDRLKVYTDLVYNTKYGAVYEK